MGQKDGYTQTAKDILNDLKCCAIEKEALQMFFVLKV